MVVLKGEMLPDFFMVVFREFVQRIFGPRGVSKKTFFLGCFWISCLSPTVFVSFLL